MSRCAFLELSPCITDTTLLSLNIFPFMEVVCQSSSRQVVKLETMLGGFGFVDLG